MDELTIRPGSHVGPQWTIYRSGVIVASTWTREDAEEIVVALAGARSPGEAAALREALETAAEDLERAVTIAGQVGASRWIAERAWAARNALAARPEGASKPRPDHRFVPARVSGEDMCTYSWRVESERTYCQQPRSVHPDEGA